MNRRVRRLLTDPAARTAAHQRRRDHVRDDLRRRLAPAAVAFADFHNVILGTTSVTVSDSDRMLAAKIEEQLSRLVLSLNNP